MGRDPGEDLQKHKAERDREVLRYQAVIVVEVVGVGGVE